MNQPHLASTVLAPQKFENVPLFDVYLRRVPGKPIVIMVPEDQKWGAIELPDEVKSKYQPDFGVLIGFAPRVGYDHDLALHRDFQQAQREGRQMIVAVKPYTGVWYNHMDFDWIPQGRIVKILGTVEDWNQNLLAEVQV